MSIVNKRNAFFSVIFIPPSFTTSQPRGMFNGFPAGNDDVSIVAN